MNSIARAFGGNPQPEDTRLITDHELERALDWLRDNAKEIGDAKRRVGLAEHMISVTEALLFKSSAASSDMKRKADARSDQRYIDAVNEWAEAAGEFEKLRAFREAAALKIEAWRSEQATYRSMKI